MKKALSYLVSTLIFNTAIAGVLTMLIPSIPFWHEFVYSQCIGLSVMAINATVVNFLQSPVIRWAVLSVSLPGSVALGMTLAFAITGVGSWSDKYVWVTMVLGLFFGLIGSITLLLSERIDAEVEHRKLIESDSEKREVEAHLKMLQAQIEPHFLFNTLASVDHLIETDPSAASRMQKNLIAYLRAAIPQMRESSTTLGRETELCRAYLNILQMRMESRLRFEIAIPEELINAPVPPMMLPTLVENAIKHGLEPKPAGGEIRITAVRQEDKLKVSVVDTGMGFSDKPGSGVGLANVRERLQALYDGKAGLTIEPNSPQGTIATIEIPYVPKNATKSPDRR
jgi:sensor histidine kinase YesM